jgi:hypothetical protein
MLGASLAGPERYDEAKPFLLSAYQATQQPGIQIPKDQFSQTLHSLWRFYQATGNAVKAAELREQLAVSHSVAAQTEPSDQTAAAPELEP